MKTLKSLSETYGTERTIQRKRQIRPGTICALVLILCCLSHYLAAETWDGVTIVTFTGRDHHGVTVEAVPDRPYIYLVDADGNRKRAPRTSIRQILDDSGRDITSQVFPESPSAEASSGDTPGTGQLPRQTPQPDSRPIQDIQKDSGGSRSGDYWPKHRRRFQAAFSGGVGFSTVSGPWFEEASGGGAFSSSVRFMGRRGKSYFGFGYRYQGLQFDDAYELVCEDVGGWIECRAVPVDASAHLNEIFFLVGGVTKPDRYTQPMAFFEFGVGIVDHRQTIDRLDGPSLSDSWIKPGFVATCGAIVPFNMAVGMSFEGSVRLAGQLLKSDDTDSATGFLYGGSANLLLFVVD